MSNDNLKEIKNEDKKAFKVFAIIMVIALIVGGIFGYMSVYLKELVGDSVPRLLSIVFEVITPYATLVLSILVIIVHKIVYTNAKKEYNLLKKNDEDDDKIDQIEEKLSYVLLFVSINMILGFFFFGIGIMILPFNKLTGDFSTIKGICFMIGFILCITSTILIQKKIVNFEKEINPLLKGSVYDVKFTEKWVDSSDEAIKLGIYKSAFKAYRSVSNTCIFLWLFCVLGYDLWNFGVMPMVMVTIIWLVQTVSYCLESIKCSKNK